MPKIPKEPRAIQITYMRELRRIWGLAQGIIAQGIDPLLQIWPSETNDISDSKGREAKEFPSFRIDEDEYNPLTPQQNTRRISQISDSELRRIWPNIEPKDIRDFAPWATSQSEVQRVAFAGQSPTPNEIESYVRNSIEVEKATRPRNPLYPNQASPPGSESFISNPRLRPPVILGANGIPMSPFLPRELNAITISKQFGWIRIALGEMVSEKNLTEILTPHGHKVNQFTANEMNRLLNIPIRQTVPGIEGQINAWRQENISLIKGAVQGPDNGFRLNPLFEDISEVVEDAHRRGLRVEQLSKLIKERYDVSDARANLIARDQILKLNSQITRSRQMAAGITKYRWITSRDERVRDTHKKLHKTIQSWDNPPDVGNGMTAHPGMSFQCRCTASPVVEIDE